MISIIDVNVVWKEKKIKFLVDEFSLVDFSTNRIARMKLHQRVKFSGNTYKMERAFVTFMYSREKKVQYGRYLRLLIFFFLDGISPFFFAEEEQTLD